jgi:hypothetical protein
MVGLGLGAGGEHRCGCRCEVEAVGYLTCVESDVKQPSELLAGASRRPVTTGQCSDRRCSGGLRVDCLKLQQCECKCKCKCVVLLCCVVVCCGVLWCVVVCCGVLWCVVFTVFTHDYVGEGAVIARRGKAAAIDRGVHATKVRRSERKSGGRSSTTAGRGISLVG